MIKPYQIYRHFKGGMYIIDSVATEEATGKAVIVYRSLSTGAVWTRPESQFFEKVPEDKENPTGQKYRFEKIDDYMVSDPLKCFTTQALIKELSARNNNPYIDTLPVGDKCFREDYIVGRIVSVYVSKDNSFQDIDVDSVYNTIEEAESRLDKLGYEYQVFIRRILKSGI